MRAEWREASIGRRTVFALSAAYWAGMVVLAMLGLASAETGYEAGRIVGFYFTPVLIAVVIRVGYALLRWRRRPRSRIWSWWIWVIGAVIGLFLVLQRAVVTLADRAAL